MTRTLLTNNDALLRDTLLLVLPAGYARMGMPLFSAIPPGHQAVPHCLRRRAGNAWARLQRTR